jgi:glucose-1-phosphate cytidylyltransferase
VCQTFSILSCGHFGRRRPGNRCLTGGQVGHVWINGGFFILKKEIFDYIEEGEDLVQEPFHRLISENQLVAYKNPGFWACVDTLKEKTMFDEMYARGETPWVVWESANDERKREILALSR